MSSLDLGQGVRSAIVRLRAFWEWYDAIPPIRKIHAQLAQIRDGWRRISRWLNSVLPKGLYARALLIIIMPMVILQSVIAFVFMERHWNVVTQRLSASVVQDVAALKLSASSRCIRPTIQGFSLMPPRAANHICQSSRG